MRSLSAIAFFVTAGFALAACGGSEKAAQPPASNQSKGPAHVGGAVGKASTGKVLEQGATGATTPQRARSSAEALRTLKHSLVRTGKLTFQTPSSANTLSSDVAGGAVEASAEDLKQGSTPAQALHTLALSRRSDASAFQPLHAQRATSGLALEATSDASLKPGISAASALQQIRSFVKESSSVTTRVASALQTLPSAIGRAVEVSAAGANLQKQGLTSATALSSLSKTFKQQASAAKQFQTAGPQSVEGASGAVQAGADATFKSGLTRAQALRAAARHAAAPQGQGIPQTLHNPGGNAVTGTPTQSKPRSAAIGELRKQRK